MVAFITTIISTGLIAQDSIEEITVTSSYVIHSDDAANDPIHILSEEELETNSTQSLGETIDSLLVFHLQTMAQQLGNQSFEECLAQGLRF